jgi:hypothetical protein
MEGAALRVAPQPTHGQETLMDILIKEESEERRVIRLVPQRVFRLNSSERD